MKLSDREYELLKAVKGLRADEGAQVSLHSLVQALPRRSEEEVRDALRVLKDRQFVKLNADEGAEITDAGVAALKLM